MRKGFTVFAAVAAASLLATPLVITATNALATSETAAAPITQPMTVAPVEVAAIAPVTAPTAESCARKVRVVYSGYGTGAPCLR